MKTITLEAYPHRKRWMRGTIIKEENRREWSNWKDEIKFITEQWFITRYDLKNTKVSAPFLALITSTNSEQRIVSFLLTTRIYDLRIIHLRMHNLFDQSFIKLKISFKRQGHRYYDHLKILARMQTT